MNSNFATRHVTAGCQPSRQCLIDPRVTHNARFIGANPPRRSRGRQSLPPPYRANASPARAPAPPGELRFITLAANMKNDTATDVLGVKPSVKAAAGAEPASAHWMLDLSPSLIPELGTLSAEYARCTFESIKLEVYSSGKQSASGLAAGHVGSDASQPSHTVQSLSGSVIVFASGSSHETSEGSFATIDRHVRPTARELGGPRIRYWTSSDSTSLFRIIIAVRVSGRIEA